MAETSELSTAALEVISGRRASLAGKRELMEKLKKALGAGKAMRQQLESAHADNETLRIQMENQQQEIVLKDVQKHDFSVEQHAGTGRYRVLKRQLAEKESELQVAQSKLDAFQMEFEAQRDMAWKQQQTDATTIHELNTELQQTLDRLVQEETRVLVFQEENNRLVNQFEAMRLEKRHQERETQLLKQENETLATKVDDLMDQLTGARQQQEDTEALYLDVSSKFNQVRREHDNQMKTATERERTIDTQLEKGKAEMAAKTAQWELEKHELTQQIESLTLVQEKATTESRDTSFSAILSQIETLVNDLQRVKAAERDGNTEDSANLRFLGLEKYLTTFIEHVLSGVNTSERREEEEEEEGEGEGLEERVLRYEVANRLLSAKLEECELALKARVGKYSARGLDTGSDTEQCASSGDDAGSVGSTSDPNGSYDLEREVETLRERLHVTEAELVACKAEKLRMVFQVAKTVDSASKLKHDHEVLLKNRREKGVMVAFDAIEGSNPSDSTLSCRLEAVAMQSEEFRSIIVNLQAAMRQARLENGTIKQELEATRTEKHGLETRISDLLAVANRKLEPDEWQKKDREVEELRSSLVQAKVNFVDQKQQLTALEKKLLDVSKASSSTCSVNNASIDAERREYEAALIEMIEMEKKLQVAYEAKQGLESTLKERLEAKAELEDRLLLAEDKIAELEQQLEQKIALISTIEDQLRSVEEERERLGDKLAKTKAKLERSRGKLEEKAIEFEAFKTTTNMLKDERSRLFNEIALLKDTIEKAEDQKAAMANSQELANEELQDQLNELADKIAELEVEKQELCARLEETEYRSEEDIHQLRERLYMLEEEKSSIEEDNGKLEATIQTLEGKLQTLEEQKTLLDAANASSSQQVSLLKERMETATGAMATLVAEKDTLMDVQQALEGKVSNLEEENVKLAQLLKDTTAQLQQEVDRMTTRAETLEVQLLASTSEKKTLAADLVELQERAQVEQAESNEMAAKLATQITENSKLENKIQALKHMAQKALQSLQTESDKCVEAEKRAARLQDERDEIRRVLEEKEAANEALKMQREEFEQQMVKLMTQVERLQAKLAMETRAAEETIDRLTTTEAALTESVELLRRDLVEAESCVMVLVEERDEAKKALTGKELKIEMMTAREGELALVAQKMENELVNVRNKSSVEAERHEELIGDLKTAKTEAEKTVETLEKALLEANASLESLQAELRDSKARVAALEKEREATRTFLNEKESSHEQLSAVQEDLEQKVGALELELNEVRESSAAEGRAAKETMTKLSMQKDEAVATLALVRQELVQAEECVMVLVEERDAAKKTLSKRELALEVLSSEHGELQLQSQSMKTELETVRNQSAVDAQAAEKVVYELKEDIKQLTESLNVAQKELEGSKGRVVTLSADCEAACKRLSDLDVERSTLCSRNEQLEQDIEALEAKILKLASEYEETVKSSEETIRGLEISQAEKKEALETVRKKLMHSESRLQARASECDSFKASLLEKDSTIENLTGQTASLRQRVESLEEELQELKDQQKSDAETAEETIRSLKEAETRTMETLESVREKLMEAESRAVSAEEEQEAARKALSEMELHREAQSTEVQSLQERIESLEGELQELKDQQKSDAETVEETIRSLKESEAKTMETLEAVREKLKEAESRAVSAEEEQEAARKALSEMESHREAQSTEVQSLQERIESLEGELQELKDQQKSDAEIAEETIRSLKESEARTMETLEAVREKLKEAESRAVSAEEEQEAARKALSEMESHREAQSTEVQSLQERIESLEGELQELKNQQKSDAEIAEETIRSLKESEARTMETLEAVREKLKEAETRAVAAEEEQEAARKALSEMESHREAQSTEVQSLQERIESLEGELQELKNQQKSDAETAEETIRSLKESEARTMETLEAVREKLKEAETRAVAAEEEQEAARKALSEMESHREAQSTEVQSLQERIESLEGELQELKNQQKSDAETAEETIRSLKESEAKTMETLEAVREKLREAETRAVSAEEEQEAAHKALNELKLIVLGKSEQVERLESQVAQLETDFRNQVQAAQEKELLQAQITSLTTSLSSAVAEATSLREQLASEKEIHAAEMATKDEILVTLKSKLEELMVAYKRRKGHFEQLQEKLTQETATNERLTTSFNELKTQHVAAVTELEALNVELASVRDESCAMSEDLRQTSERYAASVTQYEAQIEQLTKRVAAYDEELTLTRREHELKLQEQQETLQMAHDDVTKLKVAEMETVVEQKDGEIQRLIKCMRRVEEEAQRARQLEAERIEWEAQVAGANATIAQLRAATEANVGRERETIAQLETQLVALELQVKAETERASAAYAALETYKKRAHTALKKASSEHKMQLKKATESSSTLLKELQVATSRIHVLETELEDRQRQMEEVEKATSRREALEAEKRAENAAVACELASLKAEVRRLHEALASVETPLEAQITALTERNEAMKRELTTFQEEISRQQETVRAKDDELKDLSQQLQAALAAARTIESGRRSFSPTDSPSEKERRSTASSSRSFDFEATCSFLHQKTTIEENHADVASKDPVESSKDDVARLQRLLEEVQLESQVFQKKYQDACVMLEEANRHEQHHEERSTDDVNIEYLKNVIIKYLASQVPGEKLQLVPVIATLLSFSPQEQHQVLVAHKANDESGTGLLGGVLSLFGGKASASPVKTLAVPPTFKPSPTSAQTNAIGAALGSKDKNGVLSFGSDDEEFAIPLNPFAA